MAASEPTAQNPPATHGEGRTQFRPSAKLQWPAQFEVVDDRPGGSTERHAGETLGVSIGGTFVVTDVSVQVGTHLRLWLHPPRSTMADAPDVLRLHGDVRWISDGTGDLPKGIGVRFRGLTAHDEIHLHGYFSASMKMV